MAPNPNKAVVLLSGGLDSATLLAMAVAENLSCHCLSFAYGQKHATELDYAKRLAEDLGAADHRIVQIDTTLFGASALTDTKVPVPDANTQITNPPPNLNANTPGAAEAPASTSPGAPAAAPGTTSAANTPTPEIPPTYVPARNTLFLAYGLAWAESLGAASLHIGVNALDYSGYPDCRPEYIAAFESLARLATKAGVQGKPIAIQTPLLHLTKAEIIRLGTSLGLDYAKTVSCYRLAPDGRACGACDSCRLRKQGFAQANLPDPTPYRQ